MNLLQIALPSIHMADRRQCSAMTTKLGLGALAINSALAVYNSWSRGDAASVAFVLVADAAPLLLFFCLRKLELEQAQAGGRRRNNIKVVAVWTLTTLLTAMFASRVAPMMPPAVAAAVWIIAVATIAGGFWAFFLVN
ncbi:hypothetical protein BS78_10G040800 [Paspalum vaginatum]|nr:hypothetical protein BS78_10G040800 [Paspalum vaginatum]